VDALWDKFWTGGLANLYEPPLDMFGADAVERWFTKQEVQEIVVFAQKLES
jgi:type I restriction enzyme R subunit